MNQTRGLPRGLPDFPHRMERFSADLDRLFETGQTPRVRLEKMWLNMNEELERPMRTNTVGWQRVTVVAAAFCVLIGGALAMAADTPDAWITMKTKIALMTADELSTMDLNVDSVKGVVTLHGKVATEAEKAKAEQVALKVGGVHAVKNLLQVVPNAQRKTVERADADIKESVEAAFKANRRIVDSGIKVASVNKGVVLLSGKTKSLEAHYESVQVAHAVRGVRRVSSEVEVEMPNS
jgi:hyperosmotically inducible periplasmic protein